MTEGYLGVPIADVASEEFQKAPPPLARRS